MAPTSSIFNVIIVDTVGLLDFLDASATRHDEVEEFLQGRDDELIMSPFILAELNYFLRDRMTWHDALTLIRDIEERAYEYVLFSRDDLTEAREVIEKYRDLDISLADASLVVLARRYGCNEILTRDDHFRTLQPSGSNSYFKLLPADA